MDVIETIRARKSIRGYKPDPVPQEVLRDIIDIASRAPSSLNIQPWEVTVVTGEVLKNLSQGNMEMDASGATPNPDLPSLPYTDKYKQRQVELGIQMFELMGITREDKEKRVQWGQRGRRYFDAPAAIFVYVDELLKERVLSLIDIGLFVQTLCLAAQSYGLGTCIMGSGINFPEVVRKFTQIPDSKQLIICITIGYPDGDFPANKIATKRESVDNFVTWYGFE
ncbi:nitroreductase [Chloroflexota bacterium]